jgi:hypothetical protein
MYNVTLRSVHKSSQLKSNTSIIYWSVCVCVVRACMWVHKRVGMCVSALLIQHATDMLHIVISFVAPRSPPNFSTLSHKRCDFRKKVIEHKMGVLIFSTAFILNIFHSKKNSA